MLFGGRANKDYSFLCGKNKKYWTEKGFAFFNLPPILGTMKNDTKRKPAIYKLYDFITSGTGVMYRRIGTYTSKTKS